MGKVISSPNETNVEKWDKIELWFDAFAFVKALNVELENETKESQSDSESLSL